MTTTTIPTTKYRPSDLARMGPTESLPPLPRCCCSSSRSWPASSSRIRTTSLPSRFTARTRLSPLCSCSCSSWLRSCRCGPAGAVERCFRGPIGLLVVTAGEAAAGFAKLTQLHIPLGVLLIGIAAWMAISSWFPNGKPVRAS